MLPLKQMPPVLVNEMVKAAVFWPNAFPYQRGVSDDISPREILTGQFIYYTKQYKYEMW
jgi:hypothetical protein